MKSSVFFLNKIIRKKNSLFPKKFLAPTLKDLVYKDIILEDKAGKDIFFGYHDRTPFHEKSRLVLSHRSNNEHLDVGFFDLDDPLLNFNFISSSKAFSRQQGSMLQWDYLGNTHSINFNNFLNKTYKNISIDIHDQSIISEFDFPIYCLSNDYNFGLSCNFFQLARKRPGYGIENMQSEIKMNPNKDGVWLINRLSGKKELIASYEYMLQDLPCSFSDNCYINHLSFSPDDKTVVWFLIKEVKYGREIYFQGMRLDDQRKIFNIESKRLISHFCWIDPNTILGTNRDSSLNWNYSKYNIINNSRSDLKINSGFDGHPMFNVSSNKIIIDSTPDPKRYQHLLCFDWTNKKIFQFDKLITPKTFEGPDRCDLHPRWNKDSSMISVDTPINNKRCQKIIFLNKNILNTL